LQVSVTAQPSAKLQQMMHKNGKKVPLIVVKSSLFIASRRKTRYFRKKQRKHLAEYIITELL